MDLLAKHDLIDKGAIAWRDIIRRCDDIRHTFPEGVTDSMHMRYPYKYWKPKRMILDQDIDARFNQETLPSEFNDAFMNLVTETEDTVTFITEKTVTPILMNKPFLIAGSVRNHAILRDRGFLLYDEIFDYSFDSENDINLRYEGLVENIKRISTMDLSVIYKKLFDKLLYNKQHALKIMTEIPQEILDIIEDIKRENAEPYFGSLNMLL